MKNVNTNTELKEIRKHGVPEFPLEFNIDDTRDYYNNDINWHWHREFELVYILEGCITCHITQKTYGLRQGEGILINSSVLHRFTSENYGIIADIIFLSDFLATDESRIYQKYIMPLEKSILPCVVFTEEWEKELLILLKELFTRLKEPEWNELWIRNQVSQIWMIMMEHLEREQLIQKANNSLTYCEKRLQVMIQYIQEHYADPVTLDAIANVANISKTTALRYFQKNIGISPVEYLIQYRINIACRLLRKTSEKIAYISVCVGYENVSYFNRIFKKYIGSTPQQYRAEHGILSEDESVKTNVEM